MKLHDRKISGILLDITGVLYESGEGFGSAIDHSVQAIERIHAQGVPYRLVTNESSTSNDFLLKKLFHHGFKITPSSVFSPIPAMKAILREKNLRPYLVVHSNVQSEFDDFDTRQPNCVVLGDAEEGLSFANINKAFNVLMASKEPLLFSLGQGKYYRHKGQLQLDVGPFTKALEFACGIKATTIGKPSPEYFQAALKDMGVVPEEAVMVGDDISSDVGGAQECGIAGVLVKTGKFTTENLNHPTVKPDFIANNLDHAINYMI